MVHTIVRHKVTDFGQWKRVFDSFLNHRLAGGETGSRVFQSVDDPREVTVITDWENIERARRFMASDDVRTAMKSAGVLGEPDITFVQDAALVRRSSAD